MADTNNVFISWSGPRSKQAAEALREWLGNVLQNARPWMSATDIEKGFSFRSLVDWCRSELAGSKEESPGGRMLGASC